VNDVDITLLDYVDAYDDNGFSTNTTEANVSNTFAELKSIKQTEFYQAQMNGLKLDLMFKTRTANYDNQEYVRYLGQLYKIERTYSPGEFIELVCKKVI
jgi:SPP1 family predicted phage head-tail adaptor